MTGVIEGIADAMTGGLAANAVEPRTGVDARAGQGSCLNCGTQLTGAYCSACGQTAHIHRTMVAIWHDIAHSVFHFEGKIWRTLPLLAWRPGVLTRRYIDGERARFVSPMALFLFSVFMMFALFSILGAKLYVPGENLTADQIAVDKVAEQRTSLDAQLKALDRKEAAAKQSKMSPAELRQTLGEIKRSRANLSGMKRIVEGGPTVLTGEARRNAMGKLTVNTGSDTLNSFLSEGVKAGNENPNLLLYKVQTNAYKFSWALIPISVPFVWLLFFWRPRFKIYDHTIFVIYSLSFMTLFFTVLSLLWWGGMAQALLATIGTLYPFFHMYRQLRGTYGLGRFNAFIRTCLLALFTSFTIAIFTIFLFTMGLLG